MLFTKEKEEGEWIRKRRLLEDKHVRQFCRDERKKQIVLTDQHQSQCELPDRKQKESCRSNDEHKRPYIHVDLG